MQPTYPFLPTILSTTYVYMGKMFHVSVTLQTFCQLSSTYLNCTSLPKMPRTFSNFNMHKLVVLHKAALIYALTMDLISSSVTERQTDFLNKAETHHIQYVYHTQNFIFVTSHYEPTARRSSWTWNWLLLLVEQRQMITGDKSASLQHSSSSDTDLHQQDAQHIPALHNCLGRSYTHHGQE